MFSNFTFFDIVSSLVAFCLFPLIFVAPGYVAGWAFNLFSFRERRSIARLVFAIPVSFAFSPILFFLAARLVSYQFALGVLSLLAASFFVLLLKTVKLYGPGNIFEAAANLSPGPKWAFGTAIGWVLFAILFLVDWQSHGRLWLNSVSYDYSTRVQVIQAITRTGVPPVNSGYFPGHPEKLTLLYYFWYTLCSLVDSLGGRWVDARTALIASVAWCGLGIMATIAIYLRLRDKSSKKIWHSAILGIGSLTISGLDVFPALFFLIGTQTLFGRIALQLPGDVEHWNEQITAWVSSFAWVPHHVAAVIACLVGMMLWQAARKETLPRQIVATLLAGLGFASAFGLSVWVTVIFAVFWGAWMLAQFLQHVYPWPMLVCGAVALIAVLPFLLDMRQSGGAWTGNGFPLGLGTRTFGPLAIIFETRPVWQQTLVYLLALPINYFFELGFFFLIAILWPILVGKGRWKANPFLYAEVLLLLVTVTMVTFIRSTVILNNDFGWRGWLFGQFVLLIWGVDVLEYIQGKRSKEKIRFSHYGIQLSKIKSILSLSIILGISTTLLSVSALRFWTILVDAGIASYPDQFSSDPALGKKAYDGRQAFEYIDKNTSRDTVIQFNPFVLLDYPAGLYRKRQAIIATHTLYGVAPQDYHQLMDAIGLYFAEKQVNDWQALDSMCHFYGIDILVVRDTDPLWSSLGVLATQRPPLFINPHDAVFACSLGN